MIERIGSFLVLLSILAFIALLTIGGIAIPLYIIDHDWLLGLLYIPITILWIGLDYGLDYKPPWLDLAVAILKYYVLSFLWFFGVVACITAFGNFWGILLVMVIVIVTLIVSIATAE